MKINEIVNEGLLDALKFVGRAAWQAAGGKVDRNDPSITRANLEYVRKQLAGELYNQFIGGLIKQGVLTRSGKLLDPSKDSDVVDMAAQFLKQAYRAYIVTKDRLKELDDYIDASVIGGPRTGRTNFYGLRAFFNKVNIKYLEMLKDVEATTSASIMPIINSMATGINNNLEPVLRQLIKQLLVELSSQSTYSITVPRSNTTAYLNKVRSHSPISDDMRKVYDETLNAIMILKDEKKLTQDLASYFAGKIS